MGIVLEYLLPILGLVLIIWAAVKFLGKKDYGGNSEIFRLLCEERKEVQKEKLYFQRATQEMLSIARELDATRMLSTWGEGINQPMTPEEEIELREKARHDRVISDK